MDFFSQQEKIQKLSHRLSVLFALAVVGVVLMLNFGIYTMLKFNYPHMPQENYPKIFLGFSCLVITTILIAAWIRFKQFSEGGISIAFELGARLIDPSTQAPEERKLLNIVEEMALAAHLPMVEVFIIDDDSKINAFAAGINPSNAVIGITSGALKMLSRDELQGVIGHEMGHIRNGDIKLSLKILSTIYGLSIVSIIGRTCLNSLRKVRSKSKNQNLVFVLFIGIIFWIAGLVGVFFGRLLQSAISRQREYLADASSVQFTRNPEGLSNALKKIGGLTEKWIGGSTIPFEHRHFFFVSPIALFSSDFFSTHPPLLQRIKVLDPSFDGKYSSVPDPKIEKERSEKEEKSIDKLAPLLALVPASILDQSKDPLSASNLLISLMMKGDTSNETHTEISQLSYADAIKVIQLSIPSLRKLSIEQYTKLINELKELSEKDHRLSLYEYVILKMVRDSKPDSPKMRVSHFYTFKPVYPELALLFSCIAYAVAGNKKDAETVFGEAIKYLDLQAVLLAPEKCKVSDLDQAINRLVLITPKLKNKIMETIQMISKKDQTISESHAMMIELIRFSLA